MPSVNTNTLIKWVNSFDEYPHCQSVSKIEHLKSGIAICEIIRDLIHPKQRTEFSNRIIISNINQETAVNNFTCAFEYLSKNINMPNEIKNIRPQECVYDESALVRFLEFIYREMNNDQQNTLKTRDLPKRPPLPRPSIKSRESIKSERNYPDVSTIKKNIDQQKQNNASEKGTFRNQQFIKITQRQFNRNNSKNKKIPSFEESSIINVADKIDYSTKVLLSQWLDDIHLIKNFEGIQDKLHVVCKNGQIFIDLLNWLNGKKVVISHTSKHFNEFQTIEATYKKVLGYLSFFQRMNPRYLFSATELAEGNEDLFWGLLDDIYHLHHNKISSHDRRYWKSSSRKRKSFSPLRQIKQNQQQQIQYRKQLQKQRVQIKNHPQISNKQNISPNNIKIVQTLISTENKERVYQWLRQLGFSYSLDKALASEKQIYKNPLRNGTLLASLIMRLQIGKIHIIKQPTQFKHIKKNFQEINSNCLRRALNINSINHPYTQNSVLAFISSLQNLNLHVKRKASEKITNSTIRQIPQYVLKWLEDLEIEDVRNDFSKIATSVLKVNICRQTTKKIQQNNVCKILDYLKQLGMIKYLPATYKSIMDENSNIVWEIVEDLYNLKSN